MGVLTFAFETKGEKQAQSPRGSLETKLLSVPQPLKFENFFFFFLTIGRKVRFLLRSVVLPTNPSVGQADLGHPG